VARDSGDVCSRLLSQAFRSAMERDAHESCSAYYSRAQVLSIRLLRVLRTGATAALEVRYWPRGGYSTFVLDRQADGWQAVRDRAGRPAADRLTLAIAAGSLGPERSRPRGEARCPPTIATERNAQTGERS
jgi:hypothetical protein